MDSLWEGIKAEMALACARDVEAIKTKAWPTVCAAMVNQYARVQAIPSNLGGIVKEHVGIVPLHAR